MRKTVAAALITGSLLTGGAIGSAMLGAGPATAQTSSSDSSSSTAPADPGQPPAGTPDFHAGRRGPHVHPNLELAASTIGVSTDDLRSALESGQSVADVAKAHNVDPQTVIDALVNDASSKIDERVTSGDLTQEQADAIKADLPQHITDFVNHAGLPGPGGPGGPHGGDCPGMGDGTGDQGPSSGSSSSSGSDSSSSSASNTGTSFAA